MDAEEDAVLRLTRRSGSAVEVRPAAIGNGSGEQNSARQAAEKAGARADSTDPAVRTGGDSVTPLSRGSSRPIPGRPSTEEANGSGEGNGSVGPSRAGAELALELGGAAARTRRFEAAKLAMDLVGASLLLTLLSPLMFLIAIAIRLDSAGPALFRQMRTGLHGRPFLLYKFRTMRIGTEQERARLASLSHLAPPAFKVREDPRVTRAGTTLRAWSLDELPNLFNVLLGDMSLVGPRPNSWGPETYEDWQLARLSVRPGVTGLCQVGGRADLDFAEQVRLDLQYIRECSLWLDLRILGRTVLAVLTRKGAY